MATLPYAMVGKRRTGEHIPVVLAEFAFDSNAPFGQWARDSLEQEENAAVRGVEGYTMLLLEREGLVFFVVAKKEAERAGREALQLIASSFAARIGMARALWSSVAFEIDGSFGSKL